MRSAERTSAAPATPVYNRHRAPTSRLVRARRGNLFPTKQRDGKIDAAVALLMAIGRAQASESDGAEDITAFLLNPVMG